MNPQTDDNDDDVATGVVATTARCFCRAVTLRFSAAAKGVINCHCGECRRLSGSAFTTWAAFACDRVMIDGIAALTAFDVTPNVRRHFCRHCGSHAYTADRRHPGLLGVPAGLIEGLDLPQPSAHFFVDHRAAWSDINDAMPKFGGELGHERAGGETN